MKVDCLCLWLITATTIGNIKRSANVIESVDRLIHRPTDRALPIHSTDSRHQREREINKTERKDKAATSMATATGGATSAQVPKRELDEKHRHNFDLPQARKNKNRIRSDLRAADSNRKKNTHTHTHTNTAPCRDPAARRRAAASTLKPCR